MNPEGIEKGVWLKDRSMFIEAKGGGISACRFNGPNGETIERTFNDVIASRSLQSKIKDMEVMEDFGSRLHKEVTFCG